MILIGQNIRQNPAETLKQISLNELINIIKEPDTNLANQTERLRKIAQIDQTVYKSLKLQLPYIVLGTFQNNIRNTESFTETDMLVIDFENCLKTPIQSKDLLQTIVKQDDVLLSYVSPNGLGLKIIFQLDEPVTCPKTFSAFYKAFSRSFAERIHLLGTLDTRTSDCTRACFLANDPNIYYKPNPIKIEWTKWSQEAETTEIKKPDLAPMNIYNEETHQKVLKLVSPNTPSRPKIEPTVPEILKNLDNDLRTQLGSQGIYVQQIIEINYGIKIVCAHQNHLAEINVFYGKRGFSVVKTPKSIIDPNLNDRVYRIIFNFLFPDPHAT